MLTDCARHRRPRLILRFTGAISSIDGLMKSVDFPSLPLVGERGGSGGRANQFTGGSSTRRIPVHLRGALYRRLF
jgi:hypothetical protein